MTSELFSLLLDKRIDELNGKSVESALTCAERAELRAIEAHQDKAPAVVHRIRILAGKLAQPNRWGMFAMRFSKKLRQNLAELDALVQFGHSRAVWEIAYLHRKKAAQKLSLAGQSELNYLTLYHDSPYVLKLTRLKLKEESGELNPAERRELTELHRNLYRQDGVPSQVLELFWPQKNQSYLEMI
jgi:hypothetical protein